MLVTEFCIAPGQNAGRIEPVLSFDKTAHLLKDVNVNAPIEVNPDKH